MLIDMHAHSSGISHCCKIPYDQTLKQALEYGMDGVILTNHYQKDYIENGNIDTFVDNYISEYETAQKYGEQIGCRVFFGIEVTMELYPKVHMLIYGLDPGFLRAHPDIFDYTQKQLYDLVKANGGLLIQAHPFRNGTTVLDTSLMDGIEINCHPLYKNSYSGELLRIAEKNHLIVTCGGDFHADTYHPTCGMVLPDDTNDHKDILVYLLSPEEKKLCVHEPNCDTFDTISVKAFHCV